MHYPQEELPEFGLTKEAVLAAREADKLPRKQALEVEVRGRSIPGSPHMRLHILGSGSKGNCALIETPEGVVMVDCGFSRTTIMDRCAKVGVDPSRIAACVVTHEHSDHIRGLEVTTRRLDIPVFASMGTTDQPPLRDKITNLCPFRAGDELVISGLRITTFSTSHDAADPIGMRISYQDDSIGLLTDTGLIDEAMEEVLVDCRILAIESNHDIDMLRQGPYPAFLKQRIAGTQGHLSNIQSAAGLDDLLSNRLEFVVGMHLSTTNNTPDLALTQLSQLIDERECHAQVLIASQIRPLSILLT